MAEGILLSNQTADALRQIITDYQSGELLKQPSQARALSAPIEVYLAKSTSLITAYSAGVFGSGSAKLYAQDGTPKIDIASVKNIGAEIPNDSWIKLFRDPYTGTYIVDKAGLDIGCGLQNISGITSVKAADLVYPNGGLMTGGTCGLSIKVGGCIVKQGDGTLVVNLTAGCGIDIQNCTISVKTDCGIKCESGALSVRNSDLIGDNTLKTSGVACAIAVNYGCGLTQAIADGKLIVDYFNLGDGVSIKQTSAGDCNKIKVFFNSATGGLDTFGNGLQIACGQLAGQGLEAPNAPDVPIRVKLGTGLQFGGSNEVKVAQGTTLGSIKVDNLTFNVGVTPTLAGEVQYEIPGTLSFHDGTSAKKFLLGTTSTTDGDIVWNVNKNEVQAIHTSTTQLTIGSIADGQVLTRSGTTIVGSSTASYPGADDSNIILAGQVFGF